MNPAATLSPADAARIQALVDELTRAGDARRLRAVRDQLKAARDQIQATERMRLYGDDPVSWVRLRLRQFAWSKQREILEAVRDYRRVAVKSAHGVGKSWTAAEVACWWLDTHPPGTAFVVTSAPTFPQVRAILWRYIRRMHALGGLPGRVNQTEWHLGDELVAFGRKPSDYNDSAFQGVHAPYVLVILDEAGGIQPNLWVAADALTTNDGCRLFVIGNPDNPASEFRRVCLPGSGWHVITISALESPNLTGEAVPGDVAQALVSRLWVEEKAREWGEDNPLYRAKVLGEFTQDGEWQVVRSSDVAACRIPLDAPHPAELLVPVQLGVDVGGGGDETVVRERRGVAARREWRAHTDRPEMIAPMVVHAIRETGATLVNVDSIGVGFGVIGELRNNKALRGVQVNGVNVGERASQPHRFANLRAELWWEVGRGLSERRGWDLSEMENADTAVAQLLEPRYDYDPTGRTRVEKKEEVIKRLGRSPDNADALLLSYFSAPRPRIRVLGG